MITLLPATVFSLWQSTNKKNTATHLLVALTLALSLCGAWLIPLQLSDPAYLAGFLQNELEPFTTNLQPPTNILRYINLLLWYAWPALPLATWALWSKRRTLHTRQLALPALSFISAWLLLGLTVELRSAPALLLLPPLVLLAVPGVTTLRRGAANAFDWFGMMTFTIFSVVVWIAWSAMVFGWPARLARQAVRLEPGFIGHFSLTACIFSLVVTLIWFWLIATSPRSPMRGIMHWMAGLTLFWLLIAALWMPWIDYGKTYRPLAASLAKALPDNIDCIANANLPNSILASLDYFDGIRTIPLKNDAAKHCNWLLVQGETRDPAGITAAGWKKTWEDKRPGDRRENDKFRLYHRDTKKKAPAPLPELPVETPTDGVAHP